MLIISYQKVTAGFEFNIDTFTSIREFDDATDESDELPSTARPDNETAEVAEISSEHFNVGHRDCKTVSVRRDSNRRPPSNRNPWQCERARRHKYELAHRWP